MIPALLDRNVTGNWGDLGREWLTGLPGIVDAIVGEWGLTLGRPHRMTFHWVSAVVHEGRPAVLKTGVADGHLAAEADALRIVDGDGAVRLLAEDRARGALLIESAEPGTPLAAGTVDDATATGILLGAGRRFHRVPPEGHSLPHLRGEGRAFGSYLRRHAGDGPLPRRTVERAAGLFEELCASSHGDVLLHGDLHHGNVLAAERAPWLVIDPFGLVGDPGWDGGAMLYNPAPERLDDELTRLVPARIEQQADGTDLDRVVAWGFVAATLSAVWSASADPEARTRAGDVAAMLEKRLP